MKTLKLICAVVCCWLLALAPCRAVLTVTISPGYQFSTGTGADAPTVAHLNLLGLPTATITGSVDGSTGLTAGSVTGTLLADGVPDFVTIKFNGSSPRALQVLATGLVDGLGGITTSNNVFKLLYDTNYFTLATNSIAGTNSTTGSPLTNWLTLKAQSLTDTNLSPSAAIQASKLSLRTGTFLSGGAQTQGTNDINTTNGVATMLGAGLAFVTGTNIYTVTNGAAVTLKTNIGPALVLVAATSFTSGLFALPSAAGVVANTNHGLTLTNVTGGFTNGPGVVQWVLVCVTTNCAYNAGDEIDLESCVSSGPRPAFAGGGNVTNVFLVKRGAITDIPNKATGANDGSFAEVHWNAKCYARP